MTDAPAQLVAPRSRLRAMLGRSITVAELAERLREWHLAHARSGSDEEWPQFYARSLATLRNPGN